MVRISVQLILFCDVGTEMLLKFRME